MGSPTSGGRAAAEAVPAVGIIANPYSGKDIRRLVAYGATVDNLSKVRILQRVLVGLREAGVRLVRYMPDPFALLPAAYEGLRPADREGMVLEPVLAEIAGEAADTVQAAVRMVALGTRVIITLGGDGTNRLVASVAGSVPLMPLSTGTNNAFPTWVEPTIAGLAAGRVAQGAAEGLRREKRLRVEVGGRAEIALVDVALLRGDHTGAGAIWEPERLRELVATQGLPHAIGLSAVVGQVCPLDRSEPGAVHVVFGPGSAVRAPIAPGRFETLSVAAHRRVDFGAAVVMGPGPGVVAVDGERLLTVPPGVHPVVRVAPDGPVVIDPVAVLAR